MLDNTKAKIQAEALKAWEQSGRKGLLAMGTGSGKSLTALKAISLLYSEHGDSLRVLLVVPTEVLRDEGWPDEAQKWDMSEVYSKCVEGICYASLPRLQHKHYHLIVLDESHNLASKSSEFFIGGTNTYDAIMGLSATPPTDPEKIAILNPICPTVFTYSIDEAVDDKVVADYEVVVVQIPPDSKTKSIPAGTKAKPFKTTEAKNYEYLTSMITKLTLQQKTLESTIANDAFLGTHDPKAEKELAGVMARKQALFGQRMRLIYGMESKTKVAKKIMDKLVAQGRTLIFAGSIKQCEDLCGQQVYHSKTTDEYLTKFKNKTINYLGCVNALNEGANIPEIDHGLVVQLNSNQRNLVQRIGRIIRYRPNFKGKIYVLVSMGTVDEKWASEALGAIDPSRITYTQDLSQWDET